jgi:diaminopimelate epimerase
MFNPDGSEDFCGNGIRCAARHAFDMGWVGFAFIVKHLDRDVPTTVEGEKISTVIGRADYTPERVPQKNGELFNETVWSGMDSGMPLSLFGSALTTGSTHVVIPTSMLPEDDSFRAISSKIEVDPLYPNRTSVIWSQEVAPMKLQIRIWERAVGETMGCGTGSSAAAVDYLRRKRIGGTVEVVNPGGSVFVTMDSWDAAITVVGHAQAVYEGAIRLDF